MKQIVGKLIATSNESLQRRIGNTITLQQITRGDKHAQVTQQHDGRNIIIIINYKDDIYELQKTTKFKAVYA